MPLETLGKIISGRRKPTLSSALRLAEALNLEVEDFRVHDVANQQRAATTEPQGALRGRKTKRAAAALSTAPSAKG